MSLLNPAWKGLCRDELYRLHVVGGLTFAEVAEKLGTTRDVVRYAMDRYRIPRRKGGKGMVIIEPPPGGWAGAWLPGGDDD